MNNVAVMRPSKLIEKLNQAARCASRLKKLLTKLPPEFRLAEGVERGIGLITGHLRAVASEIDYSRYEVNRGLDKAADEGAAGKVLEEIKLRLRDGRLSLEDLEALMQPTKAEGGALAMPKPGGGKDVD